MNTELQKLQLRIKNLKKRKKKIVLCHGVFDLVHLGHIKHFKSAKSLGDYLIVSITSNKHIHKGPGRPIFNQQQRYEFLKEIKLVDEIIISDTKSAEDVIKKIRPDYYVKGPDYKINKLDKTKKIFYEKKLVEKYGGKIKYTDDITFSSTSIINANNYIFNSTQKIFIDKLKKKFTYAQISELISKLKKLKVCVIGEFIIDNYCFGDVVGKSGKEPHLVLQQKKEEYYSGGSVAIARNVATFVNKVEVISPFGFEGFYKKLLKKNLSKNIRFNFLKLSKDFKTIVKTRYVDQVSNYKLFGYYTLPNQIDKNVEKRIIKLIKNKSKFADMILVCDYGHKFISKNISKEIKKSKKFLSVTAQINSSNIGYHTINKYSNSDLVVINESELRQEFKDNISDVNNLAKHLIINKKIKKLIVTQGKKGAFLVDNKFKSYFCPAFAKTLIDKVGAGDAMLSISSICLKLNFEPELALFLGSIAASSAVETVGNKETINFLKLDRIIEHILK